MCCSLIVAPFDRILAVSILEIAQFVPTEVSGVTTWRRKIPEEGCEVSSTLINAFSLHISPSISNYLGHFGKRITAGVFFETAAKYAEKVGGEIVHQNNIGECRGPGGETQHILATYPDLPLQWDRICPGFRQTLLER